MAKNKTRKNKNVAKEAVKKRIKNAKRIALENVTFIGCSTVKGVQIDGFEMLEKMLSGDNKAKAATELRHELRAEARPWQVWFGVFHDDGTKQWVDAKIVVREDMTTADFDIWLQKAMSDFCWEVDTGHAKGYGWVATPSMFVDFDAIEDQIIDKFESMDVYNEAKRKALYAEYKLSEMTKVAA